MSTRNYSVKTQIFSLIGRPVVLTHEYYPQKSGVIVAKAPHKMRFFIQLDSGSRIWFDRSEFKLPPLPRSERLPAWVHNDFDGFVYAGVEGF